MYRSKAAAALIRLKEMDRKYRTNPQTNNAQDTTDSSTQVESSPKPETAGRARLDVRVPRVPDDDRRLSDTSEGSNAVPGSSRTSPGSPDIARGTVMAEEFSETTDIPEISEISRSLGRSGQRSGRPGSFRAAKDSIEVDLDEVPGPDSPIDSEQPGENGTANQEHDDSMNGDIHDELTTGTSGQASAASTEGTMTVYEGDTFEEASSTSGTKDPPPGQRLIRDLEQPSVAVRPDASLGEEMDSERLEESRGSGVIELVSPKPIETGSECEIGLDKELSRYVKEAERLDSGDLGPVCLLRSSQPSSGRRQPRRQKRHGRSEVVQRKEEPGSANVRQDEKPKTPDKDNFARIEVTIRKKSMDDRAKDSEERLDSSSTEDSKRKTGGTGSYPGTGRNEGERTDISSMVVGESETGPGVRVSSEEDLVVLEEAEDPTRVLKRLNREAIEAVTRRHGNVPSEPGGRSTVASLNRCRNERTSCSTVKHSANAEPNGDFPTDQNVGTECRTRSRRVARMKKLQDATDQEKLTDDVRLRLDRRDLEWIQKRVAALLLEKGAIRNYLKLQLQQDGESVQTKRTIPRIKPLEFPKIANFQPDMAGEGLESTGVIGPLNDRVSGIRRWLRDQYVLYREYSTLARTLNAGYVPATLEEAKQTIRRLRLETIETS